MFWRRRNRNAAALAAAEKNNMIDNTSFKNQSTEEEEDTTDAVVDPETENSGNNGNLGGNQNANDNMYTTTSTRSDKEQKEEEEEYVSPEERRRRMGNEILEAQKVLETQALARDSFTKNQRVEYIHKGTGKKYAAVIADVHFDDGLERPYFTIRYHRSTGDLVEKQTTRDRLRHVAFDEAKTKRILSAKLKF